MNTVIHPRTTSSQCALLSNRTVLQSSLIISIRSAIRPTRGTFPLLQVHASDNVGLILAECRYGSHLSKEEVDALVAPHPDTVAAVEDWLAYHKIDTASVERSSAGDWLAFLVPVSQAERMLDAKYRVYHNPSTGEYKVRTTAYALPRVIHERVAVVAPTTYFGGMKQMRATSHLEPNAQIISVEEAAAQIQSIEQSSNAAVPASCAKTITPACLQALYNTTGYTPQAAGVNKIGVSGYLDEFANDADLQVRTFTYCLQ